MQALTQFKKSKEKLLHLRQFHEHEIAIIDQVLNGAGPAHHVAPRKKSRGKRGAVAKTVRAFLRKKGGATYGEVVKAFDDRHARALGSMFAKKMLKRKDGKYVLLGQ